ncbi:hypothetical protein GCM10011521_20210 [Arenimonas soli]|uniref:Transcriptional regulator n=1 Tax=Arenimonas soli TaxID=2269504 RepID=A0ABQ1HL65_9GAMM|nr:hypothetical protein [Arenimonas soli]GGA81818.1 hypothetical protein GCM10011521_20210 [Arenimonas soli]
MREAKSNARLGIVDSSVPTEDQTTIRVRKELQELLRVIAALEGKTIFSVTDTVLTEYVRRYEATSGRPLLPRAARKSR